MKVFAGNDSFTRTPDLCNTPVTASLVLMKHIVVFILLSFCFAGGLHSQIISGRLISSTTKEQGLFTQVIIKQKGVNAKTHIISPDASGLFTIRLTPPFYNLRVADMRGCDTTITSIKVPDSGTIHLDIPFPPFCRYDASKKNNTCPVCKKKRHVIPVLYGLPVGEMDWDNYYYAGCEVTCCDPHWYCKKDKITF
jgi:hypothetical protein